MKVTLFPLSLLSLGIAVVCGCKPNTPTAKAVPAQKDIASISTGTELAHDSNLLSFVGWSGAEAAHRWTSGKSCSIEFQVESTSAQPRKLILKGWSLGPQKLVLALNGKQVYSGQLDGTEQTLTIDLPSGVLKQGMNTLSFSLPDARIPDNGDPRVLAFALRTLKIQ